MKVKLKLYKKEEIKVDMEYCLILNIAKINIDFEYVYYQKIKRI